MIGKLEKNGLAYKASNNDVNFAVTRTMFESFYGEPRFKPSMTQRQLVDAGFLGRKAGRGYYRYDGSPMPEAQQDADLGRRIFERVLTMLINALISCAVFFPIFKLIFRRTPEGA